MKSIIYFLITVMVGSIIYSAIPSKPKTLAIFKQEIVLESAKSNLSKDELSKSVEIISKRLETYGIKLFSIYPIFDKSQIGINFKNEQNIVEIVDLLTQKGKFEISETGDRNDILNRISKSDSIYKYLQIDPVQNGTINPVIGVCKLENAEKLGRYLNSGAFQVKVPIHNYFAWSKLNAENNRELSLYCLKSTSENKSVLDSIVVSDAKVQKESSEKYSLYFSFTPEFVTKWQMITKANINKPLALIIDHYVYVTPMVKDEIKGGNCSITGKFTENELKNLAAILKNGELLEEFRVK